MANDLSVPTKDELQESLRARIADLEAQLRQAEKVVHDALEVIHNRNDKIRAIKRLVEDTK